MDKNKLTPKQEKFCQAIVRGNNISEAYRQVYDAENMKPNTINRKAFDLQKNGKIRARVEELKKKIEDKIAYTKEQHIKRLETIGKAAFNAKQYNAALKAEELKGKVSGFYIDRIAQTDSAGNDINTPIVSNADLLEIMKRRQDDRARASKSSD